MIVHRAIRPLEETGRVWHVPAAIATLLLYAVVLPAGRYNVTVGGLFCALTLALSLRRVTLVATPVLIALAFLVWPCLVMGGASFLEVDLAPETGRFLASFALWTVSVLMITVAVISRTPIRIGYVFPLILTIAVFMLLQSIGTRVFHNPIGYRIVAPLIGFDIFHSYLGLRDLEAARAIGTYYEPSMCARVMGTLCFIDLMHTRKILRNAAMMLLAVVLTRSLGLIVLMAALSIILLGRSKRELIMLMSASALISMLAGPIIAERLDRQSSDTHGSVYVRVQAPMNTVKWSISNYPFGVPIGSAEALAIKTGYVNDTHETKITNGIYEFVTYFGVAGVIAIVLSFVYVVFAMAAGERERAAAVMYLALSTALSGSFLAIESSLLTYFFIVAARDSRRARIFEMAMRRSAPQMIPLAA